MALTAEQIKKELEELQTKRSSLETKKAVAESELNGINAKIAEVLPKVEKIVGSTDEGEVRKFLTKLESEIEKDLESLKSMDEEQ